jgi:molybdopterin molybdotransferase
VITLDQAVERLAPVLATLRGARVERVALEHALDRVLAGDVRMDHDVPPFRRATMDGWAVRGTDARAGAVLAVVGRVDAGAWPERAVGAGEATRVMTGAPMPEGADAVLPFEWGEERDGGAAVHVGRPAETAFVVPPGEHRRRGEVVLRSGTRLGPAALGVLATAGAARVEVFARPSVAIVTTGDELVPAGARPERAQIRESNGVMLAAQCARAGARPAEPAVVTDDEGALEAAIERGLASDLLVLSGGVSRGDRDLVPAALARAGVEPLFHRWAVQPGGPLWCGHRRDALVLGLPGNPAASFVTFELLGVPALRARTGLPFSARRAVPALWRGPALGPADRLRVRPARLSVDDDARLEAVAAPWRGSGDPFGLAEGDALALVPPGGAAPGERIGVVSLDALA